MEHDSGLQTSEQMFSVLVIRNICKLIEISIASRAIKISAMNVKPYFLQHIRQEW